MKNFVQDDEVLSLTAPYAVVSGAGFKVGKIIAIATSGAASGAPVEGMVEGVFDLAKTSAQAWSVGDLVYWDDTNKLATTTATGNTLMGVATATAANPSATGRVRLNGSFA